MVWWLSGLALLVAAGFLPWLVEVRLSTWDGVSLRLMWLEKITVFRLSLNWGQKPELKLAGLRVPIGKRPAKGGGADTAHPPAPGSGGEGKKGRRTVHRLTANLRLVTIDSLLVFTRYIRGMIRDAKSTLVISGELGLGDPAATGALYGMVWALSGSFGRCRISIIPNFFELVLAGEARVAASIIPLAAAARTLRFLIHPDIRAIWSVLVFPRRTAVIKEVQDIGS